MASKWRKAKIALGLKPCVHVPGSAENASSSSLDDAVERFSDVVSVSPSTSSSESRVETPQTPSSGLRLSKTGIRSSKLRGPDIVAEITGRRGMLIRASSGKGVVYQSSNTKEVTLEMINMNEKKLFMDGKKLVAIISEAGLADVSLKADRRALNQRRRVHLTVELHWSADRAIQQFGRTHHSNQVCALEYRLLFTNLGGERHFASIVAKRLETLGALTHGD